MTSRSGHVALITGGSKGIGFACARELAGLGHDVVIGARTLSDVESAAEHIRQEHQVQVTGLQLDVRSTDSVRDVVRRAKSQHGHIDILVNNAGVGGGGVTAELTDAEWDSVIDTNLNSVFRMTRAVLADGGMCELPWGRIINIASTAGKQGVVLAAPYSASKHGVVGFTKSLGKELATTGITVNAVCPGYVETPMAATIRQNYAAIWKVTPEDVLRQFEAKIPIGRYSTPEEVAGLVGYLTTPNAGSITAQAMNVCGALGNY